MGRRRGVNPSQVIAGVASEPKLTEPEVPTSQPLARARVGAQGDAFEEREARAGAHRSLPRQHTHARQDDHPNPSRNRQRFRSGFTQVQGSEDPSPTTNHTAEAKQGTRVRQMDRALARRERGHRSRLGESRTNMTSHA